MPEKVLIKEARALRKRNYAFLALWSLGVAIFALRWFDLAPKWFDALFFVCGAAVVILAIASAPSAWRVFKNGNHDQSDTKD